MLIFAGTLHGGCSATLIDIVGTMCLLTHDPLRPGVSVEINSSYISSAKIGQKILIEGRVLKTGRTLGFAQVDIKSEDGKMLVSGRHVKALGVERKGS
jgi:acyl-coenzyme A thioesterase 13